MEAGCALSSSRDWEEQELGSTCVMNSGGGSGILMISILRPLASVELVRMS